MVLHELDADVLHRLELHETTVHSLPARHVRDLGDAVLLHDPIDREPFWNRLAGIRWPDDPAAFDRRVDETITLFATLDRVPHIWPRPRFNQPSDLVHRLLRSGFEDLGGGLLLVLDDADRLRPALGAASGVTVERPRPEDAGTRVALADDVALVLAEAFAVEPDRRRSIATETAAMFAHPDLHLCLVRVDGEPAAVARRATFDGASYLSSIGTRPKFRGRGLGALVTAVAARDAVEAGSRWTYLGVFSENHVARAMYERLGFATVGAAPDLILR